MKRETLFGEIDIQTEIAPDNWMTPPELYPEGCFDPCPVDADFDGLYIPWSGRVFVNPPFSRIPEWIQKALDQRGNENVESIHMLLPAWTDRKWFQLLVREDCKIRFLQGRVRFLHPYTGEPVGRPPFGCMIVEIK